MTHDYTANSWCMPGHRVSQWLYTRVPLNFEGYIREFYPNYAALGLFTWEDIGAYVQEHGHPKIGNKT